MPREAYQDRRRYDDEGDAYSSRNRDRDRDRSERDRNGNGSSSRDYPERRGQESQSRDERRRERDAATASSSSQLNRKKRRSQSPDFSRDRARERQLYDRRNDQSSGSRNETRADQEERKPSNEPVFESSGLLAKESNNKNGVALKYAEPPEARKSKKKWRLYVFKDGKEIDVLHISRQSCYLMGRDRAVADIPIDHPSISKQHAVIQFRSIRERNEYGDEKQSVKPFLIDLDSANGCLINDAEVPPSRYYEMRNGDTLKLGGSQREYVLLAED